MNKKYKYKKKIWKCSKCGKPLILVKNLWCCRKHTKFNLEE